MAVLIDTRTGPIVQADGAGDQPLRQGRLASLVTQDGHGRYTEGATRRNMHMAHAIVTAPVIYTTAAGTGGPLLWNGSTDRVAAIIGVGIGITTVTTVAAALGLTGNTGQSSAPTSTTAIDSRTNMYIGGQQAGCNVFRVGTVTNAGNFFLPLADLHTGALTVDNLGMGWIDLGGALIVPPNCWCSIAASATATTTVAQLGLIWEELPL